MISLQCRNCGAAINVDDARAGSSARCPSCGASVPVPARSSPIADSNEVRWSEQAGLPPVRRREVPPPPVIDVVDAEDLARGKARVAPQRQPADTRWESQPADQSQFTAAELGLTKPVSPLRSSRQGRTRETCDYAPQPAHGVNLGQILLGCSSSSVGFLVLIGAVVMAFLEPLDNTPKFIVWLIVLLTGIFLFAGGIILTILKGMLGK